MGKAGGRNAVHTCDLVGVDVCDRGRRHALCEGGFMRFVQEVPHVHAAILLSDVEHTGASWRPVATTQSHRGCCSMQDGATLKTACKYMSVTVTPFIKADSTAQWYWCPTGCVVTVCDICLKITYRQELAFPDTIQYILKIIVSLYFCMNRPSVLLILCSTMNSFLGV